MHLFSIRHIHKPYINKKKKINYYTSIFHYISLYIILYIYNSHNIISICKIYIKII